MQDVIQELYRKFEPYHLDDDFAGCDHGVAGSDTERLMTTPLQHLTVQDLDRYAFKAMTTWGTEKHFKHFLPRLLELSAHHYLEFGFPEVLLGKLAYAKWQTWPEPERVVIERFLHQFWLLQVNATGDFPTDERIETVLGGLAEACNSIATYLDRWETCASENAAMHCAQLIHDVADDIMTTGALTLWGEPGVPCTELVAWISSDKPRQLMDGFADKISEIFPHAFALHEGICAARGTQ